MDIVPNDLDIQLVDPSLANEIEVEVDYRCFFAENQAFAPMTVSGSIHHEYSLQDFIKKGKKEYEKDYIKVEIMQVRVGSFV